MKSSFSRTVAGSIANSSFLGRGRSLWEENQKNWVLPLSRRDKVVSGIYLILQHYAEGKFPPTFQDQQKVYELERSVIARPNLPDEVSREEGRRKPFWYNTLAPHYLKDFAMIVESFQKLGVAPGSKILEIGCGGGWASNFLSQMLFRVVGTSIKPVDIEDANAHAAALAARGLATPAKFIEAPMEEVFGATAAEGPFDVAFVYEALHHAYDWRVACAEVFKALKPGGWFLLCSEPNVLHTAVAYRYSQMSRSPEIGFRKRELLRGLSECGFGKRVWLANRIGFYARPIWLAVQRPER
ncbi:MAG TPA: methyltransferase domain-containing protein [Verrucomicrobiae bacterium]